MEEINTHQETDIQLFDHTFKGRESLSREEG